jgi:putative transcriptional regulator
LETLRHIREQAGLSQPELSERSGVAQGTISDIELGKRKPRGRTLRKLAQALGVQVADLLGESETLKALAPPSAEQLPLNGFVNGFEEGRRAVWEASADQARHLREDGRARMDDLLAAWRASREREEPRAARREYMDEMGSLLQRAYDAETTLGGAYLEAALTEGGSEAKVPRYLREESRKMRDLYFELFGLVANAGLTVRTGADAAAAKRSAEVQPESRPYSVEERGAA